MIVVEKCKRKCHCGGEESSLNLVCVLLSESLHPPVIGFGFTHHSFSDARGLWNWLHLLCMSAGFLFKRQLSS